MNKLLLLLSIILIPFFQTLNGQTRNNVYNSYIDEFAPLAVEQMKRHKIPASITLAQGLLESGAGRSSLATRSNNHFGIKCHDWQGGRVYHDDDEKGECFRKYRHARESYEDHSLFLTTRSRYSSLFDLPLRDYKGWARGLSKAGYATDPQYANRLIMIIETYELMDYDRKSRPVDRQEEAKKQEELPVLFEHTVYKMGDLYYVRAVKDDSFDAIGQQMGVKPSRLKSYNEYPKGYKLQKGDIVFMQRKSKTPARSEQTTYQVQPGDNLHLISQKVGMRLKSLLELNRSYRREPLTVGDTIRLVR